MIRIETGDCLDILPSIEDRSVQRVYLDPPYASGRDWTCSGVQRDIELGMTAYRDTWESIESYVDYIRERIATIRRVLDGTLYLHCDDSCQHHLRQLCDEVLAPARYRSTVIWERQNPHCDARHWGRSIEYILMYADQSARWNPEFRPHGEINLGRYNHTDPDGRRWRDSPLCGASMHGETYAYEYRGVYRDSWRCPRESLERWDAQGLLYRTKNERFRLKRYLDESPGRFIGPLWTDIPPLVSTASERTGYPTQKPLRLLQRMIGASTDPGDTVLDPMCGSGTTIEAAGRMGRHAIGIDSQPEAVRLTESRTDGILR